MANTSDFFQNGDIVHVVTELSDLDDCTLMSIDTYGVLVAYPIANRAGATRIQCFFPHATVKRIELVRKGAK